jgi:hypothetical protein
MSWTLLALFQVALLTLLLFASAALMRRVQPAVANGATAKARKTPRAARDAAPTDDPAVELFDLRASVALLSSAAEDTREGWRRLRDGLHKVLEGAQPVMAHSSWDELHRLLCAADKLMGIPSPAISFREDEDEELPSSGETEDRWRALTRGLQELRAAATDPERAGLDDEAVTALLGALILAVDELRSHLPEAKVKVQQDSVRETELRQMILQFTHDRRDMLLCIRRLESENANQRTQLGLAPAEDEATPA